MKKYNGFISLIIVAVIALSAIPAFTLDVHAQRQPGVYRVDAPRTGALVLRAGPGTNHRAILNIPHNTRITVTSITPNGWGRTSHAGHAGYVLLDHTIFEGSLAQPPAITTGNTFVRPIVDYRITQRFGVFNNNRQMHHAAEDMVSMSGNRQVRAVGRGVVVGARQTGGANQGVVVIQHRITINSLDTYVYSFYSHLDQINVRVNDRVDSNTIIGSYTSHLHWSFLTSNPSSVGHDLWGYGTLINNNRVDRNGFSFVRNSYVISNARLR